MQTHSASQANRKALIDLEGRFWKSLVDEDADTAVSLLDEPALMVSAHGSMKFTRDDYRRMATKGAMVVKSYDLSEMEVVFPNDNTAVLTYRVSQTICPRGKSEEIKQEMADSSVWTRKDGKWLCVMHTETPANQTKGH